MTTVRIGVVGAGDTGTDPVHTLHPWVSGAEVVSVAHIDEERAAADRITAGRPQTEHRSLADSFTTLRVMDEMRRLCGIAWPPP
ncbi:hypothetical protein ABT288_04530 [Streptomyces sp. NPDC001093]|uniref:hypothetical protein n=1 Tax=Streptomyces sp. NPDC001093 TaxID=3154376 RepID=UPI00333276FF